MTAASGRAPTCGYAPTPTSQAVHRLQHAAPPLCLQRTQHAAHTSPCVQDLRCSCWLGATPAHCRPLHQAVAQGSPPAIAFEPVEWRCA